MNSIQLAAKYLLLTFITIFGLSVAAKQKKPQDPNTANQPLPGSSPSDKMNTNMAKPMIEPFCNKCESKNAQLPGDPFILPKAKPEIAVTGESGSQDPKKAKPTK